jgi:hypothetical protein
MTKKTSKFAVGNIIKIKGWPQAYEVVSLTIHDDVYCIAMGMGFHHVHASNIVRA